MCAVRTGHRELRRSPTTMRGMLHMSPDRRRGVISLIGAPTDVGAGVRGASMGPEALRVAGLAEVLRDQAHDVRDCGDLPGPRNPLADVRDGYRHLHAVAAWNRLVHDA